MTKNDQWAGAHPDGGPPLSAGGKNPSLTHLSGLRLLVVDDDYVSRMALERILLSLGLQAESAEDGSQALEALVESVFDGVLMDVRMAVMDGLEATRRIRTGEVGEANRDLPIIAVTAHALDGDKDRILSHGMNAYLAKPFFVEDLIAVLIRTFPR